MVKTPFLSVIIPVFDEEDRLDGIKKVARYLAKQTYQTELIVVNDGSSDDTLRILRKLKPTYKLKIISYLQNRGKGYAVTQGMLQAKGEWRLFMDVDLSVPLNTITTVLHSVRQSTKSKTSKKNQVIIGTRRLSFSQVIVRQNSLREGLGQIFTKFSQVWLGVKVSDFTCGFKLFSAKAAGDIFSRVKVNGWGFDSEVLFLAQILGFKIKEIPVTWKNDPRTKVKFPQDIIKSLWELLQIRYFFWMGEYR